MASLARVGDCLVDVAALLAADDLAAAEQAQVVQRRAAVPLYAHLAEAQAQHAIAWGPDSRQALDEAWDARQTDGKRLLRELRRLRALFVVSQKVTPEIESPAVGTLVARPSKDHAGVASLPVALGTVLGGSLAVGVRLRCEGGVSRMREGCCVGVMATGLMGPYGVVNEISLAPTTGHCYHEYGGDGPVMGTRMMAPLPEAETEGQLPEEEDVEVWVEVTPAGDIRFIRRFRGEVQTGALERASMPPYVSEYFAAALFMTNMLEAPTRADVVYSSASLPDSISRLLHSEASQGFADPKVGLIWSVYRDEAENEAQEQG